MLVPGLVGTASAGSDSAPVDSPAVARSPHSKNHSLCRAALRAETRNSGGIGKRGKARKQWGPDQSTGFHAVARKIRARMCKVTSCDGGGFWAL